MLSVRCLSCLSVLSVCNVDVCGQTVGQIKTKLGMQVGRVPGHILLGGDPAPPPLKGHSPQFSAHIFCGQMAAWIKMSLGTEVGLGLRDIVFDVDPATPQRKGTPTPPHFGHVYCGQMAGWMKDAAWYGSRPRPRPHCTRRGSHLPRKGTAPPFFSAHVYCGHGRPSHLLLSSYVIVVSRDHVMFIQLTACQAWVSITCIFY